MSQCDLLDLVRRTVRDDTLDLEPRKIAVPVERGVETLRGNNPLLAARQGAMSHSAETGYTAVDLKKPLKPASL
jgi:hypothetical protein